MLVGYGRVGKLIGQHLRDADHPFLVIEDADKTVAMLREAGIETIVGNAARADNLAAANLEQASHLVVAIPNAFEAGQVVEQARAANPRLQIYARAHSDAEVEHLDQPGRRRGDHGRTRDRPRHHRSDRPAAGGARARPAASPGFFDRVDCIRRSRWHSRPAGDTLTQTLP